MSPQIGQPVQAVRINSVRAAVITAVNSDGTVDAKELAGSNSYDNVPYVQVGGAAPSGVHYIQEIALAAAAAA